MKPAPRGKSFNHALLRQDLRGVGIRSPTTEVSWDDVEPLAFFQERGFRPAPRFCLELGLERED